MSNNSDNLIKLAVAEGYISQSQADLLHEELFMFPGGNILAIMQRRGMLTPEQSQMLTDGETRQAQQQSNEDMDLDFNRPSALSQSKPLDQAQPLSRPSPFASNVPSPGPGQASAPLPPGKPMASRLSEAINVASQAANLDRPSTTAQPLRPQPPPQRPLTSSPPPQRPLSAPPIDSSLSRKPLFETTNNSTSDDIKPDPQVLRYFTAGRERGCSDLHITVGKPPYYRHNGNIFFEDEPAITPPVAEKLCLSLLTREQRKEFDLRKQVDFSFGYPGIGRYRANVYTQRLGMEGSFRFIPEEVPTLDSLKLPKVLEKLTTYTQGLNLVTGPGGSGKTTTVAAMLEYINRHRNEHIITVEDPVEYVLTPASCQITQREVGRHTQSFASALRTALRQDPDVIMIGELRDLETTSISITAAETGHLVFGTLHTSSAIRTVARILDVYPPNQRSQICLMVAESLRGIMSQVLIPRKQGPGRACAMEILLVTTGVSQVIKEGKTHQLVSHMQSGRRMGMISMDDAIMELFQAGVISGKDAYANAESKSMFEMARNQA